MTRTDAVNETKTELSGADTHTIHLRTWLPSVPVRGVIQILHGLGEHSARYRRFADDACMRGLAVVAHDHRGHGECASPLGHIADRDGWQLLVDDTAVVRTEIDARFSTAPVILLGHSMGSFLAQQTAAVSGDALAGLILSGSAWLPRLKLALSIAVTRGETWRLGRCGHSPVLQWLSFETFNRRFAPNRTVADWLSRDIEAVDEYVSDPFCGGPFSCATWTTFLSALWRISDDRCLEQIRHDLPVLISGGQLDAAGGESAMAKLASHYARTGHQRIKLKVYPEARHEMLNESNRTDVTAEWLDWIDATIRVAR